MYIFKEQDPIISKYTLKMEKENAYAMIHGYDRDDGHYYQSIYVADDEAWSLKGDMGKYPRLLTVFEGEPREGYKLSQWGQQLNVKNWEPQLCYISVLEYIYEIQNCNEIWNILCHNGIFDIWEPEAPLRRLGGSTTERRSMILLLRMIIIIEDMTNNIVKVEKGKNINPHFYYLKGKVGWRIHVDRPILTNEHFENYRHLLESSASDYIKNKIHVCDTIQFFKK